MHHCTSEVSLLSPSEEKHGIISRTRTHTAHTHTLVTHHPGTHPLAHCLLSSNCPCGHRGLPKDDKSSAERRKDEDFKRQQEILAERRAKKERFNAAKVGRVEGKIGVLLHIHVCSTMAQARARVHAQTHIHYVPGTTHTRLVGAHVAYVCFHKRPLPSSPVQGQPAASSSSSRSAKSAKAAPPPPPPRKSKREVRGCHKQLCCDALLLICPGQR